MEGVEQDEDQSINLCLSGYTEMPKVN